MFMVHCVFFFDTVLVLVTCFFFPKACTGADSGRYFERMESPATLLRSSKASMTTLPAVLVMVTSYLKSTLMSDMGVLCLHCFSILL